MTTGTTNPDPVCPLCGGGSNIAFEKEGHTIFDCVECSHRFAPILKKESHVAEV